MCLQVQDAFDELREGSEDTSGLKKRRWENLAKDTLPIRHSGPLIICSRFHLADSASMTFFGNAAEKTKDCLDPKVSFQLDKRSEVSRKIGFLLNMFCTSPYYGSRSDKVEGSFFPCLK